MAEVIHDFSRLCLHTYTTRSWSIEECALNYSQAGITGITVWRNVLENKNPEKVKQCLDDNGMQVVSLCRGGFFPSVSKKKREAAITDNLLAIEQARALGAPLIVLVCGADHGQSLAESREQIAEGIIRILPDAEKAGVKLAVEPLHPVFAGDRSAINTLKQANDLAELINSPSVGVAIDVYHLWWDPALEEEIKRCGDMNRLFAFHISDWKVPVTDVLNDRGLMGEGCIDIPEIRSWVEAAGFTGFHEVEIFSEKYWTINQFEYLGKIKEAYLTKS